MKLSDYREIFEYGRAHNITIGGFNSANLESMQGIVEAANEMDTPLIVQCYHRHIDLMGADYMAALAQTAARNSRVPIAMGLDHGQTFEQAQLCIDNGFSGVMIDLSSDNYDRNVEITKRVVEVAHARGISVEAEIGKIFDADATVEEIATGYTDPDVARRFAQETKVDCLAVSIGTAHGIYAFEPKINFELLGELIDTVCCPIVVHGGSDTPDDDILKMVKLGIAKLNVGTELFNAYKKAALELLTERGVNIPPEDVFVAARNAVKEAAKQKLKLLTAYRK